jgi:UDP-N-acetylglucosamine--N-acetylmuramyl-(pentapeptide) pyrophosphoryl-undecaprenol N-acetylglucosamine transferase
MDDAMRVVVACGGTGGHIFPAVAVVEQLSALTNGQCQPLFLGSRDRMETRLLPSMGYEFVGMPIEGFRGLSLSTLTLPFKILRSILIARRAIRRFKPHAVICTGAYISYPAGVAASLEGVPLIVLESNLNPGKSNARLVDRAAAVVLAFEDSRAFYPAAIQSKLHVLGNPVRTQINPSASVRDARIWWGLDPDRETVLVFGGSLGARAINDAVEASLENIAQAPWQMIWQTGKGHVTQRAVPENVKATEFIDDMGAAYAAADLVVSRSGATTIAELGIVGKPAILVPLPSASTNEQKHNANVVARHGAAEVIANERLGDELWAGVERLMANPLQRAEMSANMCDLGRPNAARDAADLIIRTSLWKGGNA